MHLYCRHTLFWNQSPLWISFPAHSLFSWPPLSPSMLTLLHQEGWHQHPCPPASLCRLTTGICSLLSHLHSAFPGGQPLRTSGLDNHPIITSPPKPCSLFPPSLHFFPYILKLKWFFFFPSDHLFSVFPPHRLCLTHLFLSILTAIS